VIAALKSLLAAAIKYATRPPMQKPRIATRRASTNLFERKCATVALTSLMMLVSRALPRRVGPSS
jgi:hypothetical protein